MADTHRPPPLAKLLDRYRLREISGFVDVGAARGRDVVREHLQRNRVDDRRLDVAHLLRHRDDRHALRGFHP